MRGWMVWSVQRRHGSWHSLFIQYAELPSAQATPGILDYQAANVCIRGIASLNQRSLVRRNNKQHFAVTCCDPTRAYDKTWHGRRRLIPGRARHRGRCHLHRFAVSSERAEETERAGK